MFVLLATTLNRGVSYLSIKQKNFGSSYSMKSNLMYLHASRELGQLHIFKICERPGNLSCIFSVGVVFFHVSSPRNTISRLSPLSVAGSELALTIRQYHKAKSECLGKEMVSPPKFQIHSVVSKGCRNSYAFYFVGTKTNMYLESIRCSSQTFAVVSIKAARRSWFRT